MMNSTHWNDIPGGGCRHWNPVEDRTTWVQQIIAQLIFGGSESPTFR